MVVVSLDAFIKECSSHVGYVEGNTTPFGTWYEKETKQNGFAGASWCDMFLSYCANRVGELKNVGLFAYTPYHVEWFKKAGKWHNGTSGIKRGDIVFFDWDGGEVDHVGVVTAVNSLGIHTIEGNTGDACRTRVRTSGIRGYGRPTYGVTTGQPPSNPKPEPKPTVPIPNPKLVQDGEMGPKTWKAMQRILNYRDAAGLAVDGEPGPFTIRALQRALNRGKL